MYEISAAMQKSQKSLAQFPFPSSNSQIVKGISYPYFARAEM